MENASFIEGLRAMRFHKGFSEFFGDDKKFDFRIINQTDSDSYILYVVCDTDLDSWFRKVLNSGISTDMVASIRKGSGGTIAIKYLKDNWTLRRIVQDFHRIFRDKNIE